MKTFIVGALFFFISWTRQLRYSYRTGLSVMVSVPSSPINPNAA